MKPPKLKKAIFCCAWFDDTWCDKNTPLSIVIFDNKYYLTLGQHLDTGWMLEIVFCPKCGKQPRKLRTNEG
jgi:hypothetical protein